MYMHISLYLCAHVHVGIVCVWCINGGGEMSVVMYMWCIWVYECAVCGGIYMGAI